MPSSFSGALLDMCWHDRVCRVGLLCLVLGVTACISRQPLSPLPPPLPETLAWEQQAFTTPFLGLETEENDSGSLDELFFEPGVRVAEVVPRSPADQAGLRAGDVILTVAGETVDDPVSFEVLVADWDSGHPRECSIRRGDTAFSVTLVPEGPLSPLPPPEILWREDPARSRAGWMTTPQGVRFVTATADSPLLASGIPIGAEVIALDGEVVHSDRDLIRRFQSMDPGSPITLSFADGSERRTHLIDQPTMLTSFWIPIFIDYEATPDGSFSSLEIFDFGIFSLFSWEQEGAEDRWTLLMFIKFSANSGVLE